MNDGPGRPRAATGGDFRLRLVSSMVMLPAAAATVFAGGPAFLLGVALVCGLMAWEWGSLVADLNGRGLARGVILGVSTLALGWMLLSGPYWGVGVGVVGAVGNPDPPVRRSEGHTDALESLQRNH